MSQSVLTKLFPLPFEFFGTQSPSSLIPLIDATLPGQSVQSQGFDFFLDGTISTKSVISSRMILPISTIESSVITFLSITGVLNISINSMIKRLDQKSVDVSVKIIDFSGASISQDFIEYSLDGIAYSTATIDTGNIDNTLTFPTTALPAGTTSNLVWKAFDDIGTGSFTNIHFRIGITDGTRSRSVDFIMSSLTIPFGLGPDIPSPPNLRVTNVDNTPISKVELAWDVVSDADLRKNYLFTNDAGRITAQSGLVPNYVLAHTRSVVGYKLYGNSVAFTPPAQGTLLADEITLTKLVLAFIDFTISQNEKRLFKIGTVAN